MVRTLLELIFDYIAPRTATAHVILAMVNQKLGKTESARVELTKARQIIQTKYESPMDRGTPSQGFWFDWQFAHILLQQASTLIEKGEKNRSIVDSLQIFSGGSKQS